MREILFRGKTPDGMWIFGDYIKGAEKTLELCVIKERIPVTHNYLCNSDTVGQYTGLTDKNGRKIFEGDIVQQYTAFNLRKDGNPFVVDINTSLPEFEIEYYSPTESISVKKIYEVIGNIHDNPELLEVKE